MARVSGPLMSLEASGTVADTITFAKWRGRAYVRKTVKPSNPDTIAQQGQRALTRFVSQAYADLSDSDTQEWVDEGKSKNITGLNAWLKNAAQRKPLDQAVIQTPSTAAGTTPGAPTSPTATGGRGFVTFAWTNSVTGTLFTTAIYQGATGFTPGPANLKYILPAADQTITLTGFEPGTYFFKIEHGNVGGIYGTATAELSATVT